MFDQGLFEAAGLRQDLLRRVNDPIFQAKQEVEIPQAEVSIENDGLAAFACESNSQIGRGGGLADAALPSRSGLFVSSTPASLGVWPR